MNNSAPKNPGKNGRFENSRANLEAQKLVEQWNENQGKEEAKPTNWMSILFFFAAAAAFMYWLKNGG